MIGEVIEKFEVIEKIGEGGMAEVFRARLPGVAGFEKILVIKKVLANLASWFSFKMGLAPGLCLLELTMRQLVVLGLHYQLRLMQ